MPQGLDRGIYQIKIVADDGHGATTQAIFYITVPNTDPYYTFGTLNDQIAIVGIMFNYFIPSITFYDVDGDSLSYLPNQDPGLPLPAWLNFDSVSLKFYGIP